MKIDLHIHTKKVLSGELDTRTIEEAEKFIRILSENKVGIAGITNHNIFDIEQFEEFEKENKENKILLIPGIELEVQLDNTNRRHLNILYPPDKKRFLKECHDKLKNKNCNEYNETPYYKLRDVLNIFTEKNAIFMPDHKRNGKPENQRWWEDYEIQELRVKIDKRVCIVDTKNTKTRWVLMANNFHCFIGSDVRDWNEYPKLSESLINTELEIKNYNKFISILKYDEKALTSIYNEVLINKKQVIPNFELQNNKKNNKEKSFKIKGMKLYQGVNVIFGPKHTGKSAILKEIENIYNSQSISYESSRWSEYFKKIEESDDSNLPPYINERINEITKSAKEIKDFKEISYPNIFNDIYEYVKNLQNNTITFHNSMSSPHEYDRPTTNQEIKKLFSNIKNTLTSIEKIFKNKDDEESEVIDFFSKAVYKLRPIIKEKYNRINKDYWKYNFKKNIYKELCSLLQNSKGEKSQPDRIGLYERWDNRRKLISNLEKIQIEINESDSEEELSLPDRKVIKQRRIICDPFEEESSWRIKNQLKSAKNEIRKISQFNDIAEFQTKKFIQWMKSDKVKKILDGLIQEPIIITTEFIENINGEKKFANFSNGEKTLLTLLLKLKVDPKIKYYLLDEPDVYLDSKSISQTLLEHIKLLRDNSKTVVIATHNPTLALNSVPINMIYRIQTNKSDDYFPTYFGNIWENWFVNSSDKEDKINFSKTVLENFEGDWDKYEFRKDIYENSNK